jgi:transcription elongation GreA/GreB family factor
VISYQTAVGQALLKKKPGDSSELPTEGGGKSKVRIVSVRPYRT